jgi:hypothetical protein
MIKSLRLKWLLAAFLSICSMHSFGQTEVLEEWSKDTTEFKVIDNEIDNSYEDDSPFLLLLLIIAAVVMLFCFGVGVVVAVCIILIFSGLLAVGILSTSVAVGLYKKSLASGFKTLIVSSSTTVGAILGFIVTYIIYVLIHQGNIAALLIIGASSGAIGGLGFGYLAVFAFRKMGKIILMNNSSHKQDVK